MSKREKDSDILQNAPKTIKREEDGEREHEDDYRRAGDMEKTKSFKFCYNKRNYKVTCDASMTIQEALHTNDSFKSISGKNQRKEMIIERRTTIAATVTPDFPICLIDVNEILDIDFKSVRKISTREKTPLDRALMAERENFVSFYISKSGGANIQYILQHINVIETSYVCVYAVKRENVEVALRRDGRFKEKIFLKGILYEESSKTFINLSEPVDFSLDGMKFQIIINPNPTKGLKSTQIDKKHNDRGTPETSIAEEKKTETPLKEKESRKYLGTKETLNTQEILNILREQHSDLLKTLKQRENLKSNVEVKSFSIKEIPDTQEIHSMLKNQYTDLVKTLKQQENLKDDAELKRFFRVEYDKSVQSFSEVNRVKQLMVLSDSVCQIRNGGSPKGTGFLLFKRFVLTNAHVVRDLFGIQGRSHNLTAVFRFEVLNSSVNEIRVEQNVVAAFSGKDDMGNHLDFALLELSDNIECTELIRYYSPPPISGGVCIIGHPDNGVKQMDPCFIITKGNVEQEATRHCENNQNIHVINERCIAENWEVLESQISYNSCFFHGSSGSPVFDDHCNLIGVHTGGYVYLGQNGEKRSMMEYGFPMFPILKQILIQCNERGKSDVVQDFIDVVPGLQQPETGC